MYIISMTSFGERLVKESILTIESILNNTVLPDKICIIINNFDKDKTPSLFKEHPLIEIIYSDLDIKGHNKYYHTIKKYTKDVIITIDDDVVYPETFIEDCINAYKNNPNQINAGRCHKIRYKEDSILQYKYWEWETKELTASKDLFFTGIGGVIYPPGSIKLKDLNIETIKEYLYVDDIYLNYICRKNGYNIGVIPMRNKYKDLSIVYNKHTLCRYNILYRNDLMIKKIKFYEIQCTNHKW